MDYIYSQLNNTVELLEKQFTTTILETAQVIPTETKDGVELNINTENLVRLLPIVGESNNDIQEFQLFGYNVKTELFDIPIGESIKINCTNNGTQINLNSINFKDACNNLIKVDCEVGVDGTPIIPYIPINALSDTYRDENGDIIQVESIIDGNN